MRRHVSPARGQADAEARSRASAGAWSRAAAWLHSRAGGWLGGAVALGLGLAAYELLLRRGAAGLGAGAARRLRADSAGSDTACSLCTTRACGLIAVVLGGAAGCPPGQCFESATHFALGRMHLHAVRVCAALALGACVVSSAPLLGSARLACVRLCRRNSTAELTCSARLSARPAEQRGRRGRHARGRRAAAGAQRGAAARGVRAAAPSGGGCRGGANC